ncbi:uncharacterized protein THITE_2117094 [Thermothielavioides terrestris NRRL 8126]|uniref:C2H2-type domain-containing protein n=1 Tax=Thermothielavioides terrestris (strain ATCC 38088 / NRRL 8126) TaxID=578455 RepID=G2R7K9_THETT|nr:uncharacterized protein THITE_2117094 [Thermothielavioides terrestris NRRL 8126]AEO67918.1 hypothetical protein THITE_2117094 [Thermothielavioides terrestris NRRL 8126]
MADIFARIQSATDHEVRTVLAGLCADRRVRESAGELFDRLERASKHYAADALYICINCRQAYVEALNAAGGCRYHPGHLVLDPDSDAWVDCYGDEIRDDEDMRRDNPDGFEWSCCGKSGSEPGCTRASHKQGGAKRARTGGAHPQPVPRGQSDGGSAKRARVE